MAFGIAIIALLTPVGGSAAYGLQAVSPPQPVSQAPQPPRDPEDQVITPEDALIEGRRRPGVQQRELSEGVSQTNEGAVRAPPPEAFPTDQIPVPDRWRLIESLGVVKGRWFDPYGPNTLKGDRPICIRSDEDDERRRREGYRHAGVPGRLRGRDPPSARTVMRTR